MRVPEESGIPADPIQSTQEAFGRALVRVGAIEGVGERLVTVSPDVAVSTNLGGWINRAGVYSPSEQPEYFAGERALRWHPTPTGRHIELGISEMNLFSYLTQLGLTFEHQGETLMPVGTVYDPFILRGLDALIYGLYNESRFIVVGTPSGVTLAPEGGAHQSSITASIGLELPNLTFCEPSYARPLDWLLCDGMQRLTEPNGGSTYLRLSTRPLDQTPFLEALERLGRDRIHRDVIAGGYVLRESHADADSPEVYVFASGAVMPEVLAAADLLDDEGVGATVIDVTSLDRLYRGWRESLTEAGRSARRQRVDFHLARLIPPRSRHAPIVTIHDSASHTMAWVGSVFGTRTYPVGVDGFGQSGTISDLYGLFDLQPEQILNTALLAVV
jgi:pyruvate dehydrogenase E1 component